LFDPMNMIDLLAILPFHLNLILNLGGSGTFLRVLRLLRVFRIFKMSKYSSGMQLLGTTMSRSLHTLALLLVYLLIAMVVFSSMIFFAEMGTELVTDDGVILARPGETTPSPFSSIPASFWWSLVTMTTVGYGDVVPVTWVGQLVGTVTMLCGVLVLALPINVVGGNFVEAYATHRKQEEVKCEEMFSDSHEKAQFFEKKCTKLVLVVEEMKQSLEKAMQVMEELEEAKKNAEELAHQRREDSQRSLSFLTPPRRDVFQ